MNICGIKKLFTDTGDYMGDKIMTIDHNGITKIPLISNDAGCARVAQTTNIPASSVKNVKIRVSNTRSNSCVVTLCKRPYMVMVVVWS
jgi:hypothetical protein